MIVTYLGAGVLIAAARGTAPLSARALVVLDDPQRESVSSAFVELEVLPKAIYNRQETEAEFYRTFFEAAVRRADLSNALVSQAQHLAQTHGLSAIDALHVASALALGADELVTTEKPEKPMHRATSLRITSLAPSS